MSENHFVDMHTFRKAFMWLFKKIGAGDNNPVAALYFQTWETKFCVKCRGNLVTKQCHVLFYLVIRNRFKFNVK